MTEQQKKDVEEGFSRFSAEEREVLRRAMEQIAAQGLDRDGQYAMVLDLILARRRAGQRYDSQPHGPGPAYPGGGPGAPGIGRAGALLRKGQGGVRLSVCG